MRKVILSMMVSLDGYTEGRQPQEDWHHWGEDMSEYMMDFFKGVDTFIYGRKSYEDMIAYWPQCNDEFARIMNKTRKLVFSKTLQQATWNTRIVNEDPKLVIPRLKQEPGLDMALFAGAELAGTFIQSGLIDEYRLIINPVILKGRKPLFGSVTDKLNLHFKKAITFSCGNCLLIYEP